jgi:hypothetical protein
MMGDGCGEGVAVECWCLAAWSYRQLTTERLGRSHDDGSRGRVEGGRLKRSTPCTCPAGGRPPTYPLIQRIVLRIFEEDAFVHLSIVVHMRKCSAEQVSP